MSNCYHFDQLWIRKTSILPSLVHSARLFLSIHRSEFVTGIIFFLSKIKNKKTNKQKLLLTFLTRQVYWQQMPFFVGFFLFVFFVVFFLSEKVFISPSPLKHNFRVWNSRWMCFFPLNSLNFLMHSPLIYMIS